MVVLDTVRQDHLSVYGYERPTTPNLERLAEQSTLFHRAIATSDVTLSSHASLFTGLYPSSHGAHYAPAGPPMGRGLRQESTTMAEVLAKSGYTTAAVVANFGYLGPEFGLMQGFQHVNSLEPVRLSDGIRNFYLREGVRRVLRWFMSDWEFFLDSRRAEEINEDAFHILAEASRRKSPLFLFLNYLDAHFPYVPPAPYDRKFPGFDPSFTYWRFDRMQAEVTSLRRKIRPSEQAHLISQYDGAIAYLDSQLGILFDRLKQLGLYEDSLIIVTSDHGEAFGERSLLQHAGVSVYQDEVLVPLLIKYPGKARKALVTENVSQVDVFPSVMDALGLPVPRNIAGRSLAGQPPDGDRLIFSESFPNNFMARFHPRFRRVERALFVGSLKLIRSTAGKRELYNVTDDPHENRNLYGGEQGRRLETALQDWLETVRLGTEPQAPPSKPSKRVVDRLRTLGYVQ
jgi:arylsulfatase A-like enzyme